LFIIINPSSAHMASLPPEPQPNNQTPHANSLVTQRFWSSGFRNRLNSWKSKQYHQVLVDPIWILNSPLYYTPSSLIRYHSSWV